MLKLPHDLARSILDAAPDAIVIIDAGGIVRFANQQVAALFGYRHDEIVGADIETLVPERLRARHGALRSDYVRSDRPRPMGVGLALFGRRKDGSEFPVEISLSPIVDGEQRLAAAAIRDVTDRKRAEAELIAARESADRANQAKSRFLATASHDLRQPLQSLTLLNGTLRRLCKDPDAVEALAQQDHAIVAMARLLNALLDIGKVESGAVQPQPQDFEIAGLLQELGREFSGLAASKKLEFRVVISPSNAHSDPALVEQILRNLVSNAIKYTKAGFVELRSERIDSKLCISIRDSGVGIPHEQLAYIYDEFFQVGVPINSSRDGYGLGLSIVQRLVRLLGLELEVESEVGKGSTFTLKLPLGAGSARVMPARTAVSLPPAPAPGKARVLLVEDDAAVRNATRLLLSIEGYEVIAVSCLAEAMEALRQHGAPALLITDYHLANGETGAQVIKASRAHCGGRLRAVLITGDTSSAVQQLALDADLRLASKPVATEELLGLVRSMLAG